MMMIKNQLHPQKHKQMYQLHHRLMLMPMQKQQQQQVKDDDVAASDLDTSTQHLQESLAAISKLKTQVDAPKQSKEATTIVQEPAKDAIASASVAATVSAATVTAPPVVAVATAPVAASAAVDTASIKPTNCDVCDEPIASVYCEACDMSLCDENGCNADMHKPAKMVGHIRKPIDQPAPAAVAPAAAAVALVVEKPAAAAAPVKVEPIAAVVAPAPVVVAQPLVVAIPVPAPAPVVTQTPVATAIQAEPSSQLKRDDSHTQSTTALQSPSMTGAAPMSSTKSNDDVDDDFDFDFDVQELEESFANIDDM
jgi:hypothetical protein